MGQETQVAAIGGRLNELRSGLMPGEGEGSVEGRTRTLLEWFARVPKSKIGAGL